MSSAYPPSADERCQQFLWGYFWDALHALTEPPPALLPIDARHGEFVRDFVALVARARDLSAVPSILSALDPPLCSAELLTRERDSVAALLFNHGQPGGERPIKVREARAPR